MIIQQTTQFKLCTKDYTQVRAAATVHKRSREELSHVRGRGSSQEELPHIRGQGQWPRGATLHQRSGAVAKSARLRQCRSSPEELPYVQGAVAAWAQEGLEELFHVQGQEGLR